MTAIIHSLIFQILFYIIQLGVVILLGVACDFVIKKAGQTKFATAVSRAEKAVKAAEQMLGPGVGAEKKKIAVEWLTKAFGKKLSSDEIDQLIESAVHGMNMVLKAKVNAIAPTGNSPS
jgi:imidazoleglycerol phosphate synthase glutamine amidotransferase subunit HisH